MYFFIVVMEPETSIMAMITALETGCTSFRTLWKRRSSWV